jgi:DNA-binding MarR family transcriptional regulator
LDSSKQTQRDGSVTLNDAEAARPLPARLPEDHVGRVIADWHKERPELPVDAVGIVYRVCRLATHFMAAIHGVLAGSGVSAADLAVLATLRRSGHPYRLRQRQLMAELGLTSGTISVRIDQLIRRGLVSRDPEPNDGRGVLITLTEHGERLFDSVAPEHLANEARLVAALDPRAQAQLAHLLHILLIEFEPVAGARPDEPLGFTVAPAHVGHERRAATGLPLDPGLLIDYVLPGGPAEASGLRRGDLLMGGGDRDIRSLADLADAIAASPGELTLTVKRGEHAIEATIPASCRPQRSG